MEKINQPLHFTNGRCKGMILSLKGGSWNNELFRYAPWDEIFFQWRSIVLIWTYMRLCKQPNQRLEFLINTYENIWKRIDQKEDILWDILWLVWKLYGEGLRDLWVLAQLLCDKSDTWSSGFEVNESSNHSFVGKYIIISRATLMLDFYGMVSRCWIWFRAK